MVAPVTGPFVNEQFLKGPPNRYGYVPIHHWMKRTSYRQSKPHDLPLPFRFESRRITTHWEPSNVNYKDYTYVYPANATDTPSATAFNKARERFGALLRTDAAELAVNLAERKQAMSMIAARLTQLWTFSKQVKQFRWDDAARTLGISKRHARFVQTRKGLKRDAKSFANNWLEFHFGWSPLIGDIGSAIETLQGGVPPCHVRASAQGQSVSQVDIVSQGTTNELARHFEWNASCRIGAEIQVNNPNLFLANQLGFVNPATVAWELVPFSFVVDWFVNVSDFLGSFTEFWGLSMSKTYVSYLCTSRQGFRYTRFTEAWTGESIVAIRSPGPIPGPSLRVRPPWRLSPTRGLTAASLLLQSLR